MSEMTLVTALAPLQIYTSMLSEKNGPRAPEIKIYDVYNEWANPFPTNSLRPLLSQMADVRLEPHILSLKVFIEGILLRIQSQGKTFFISYAVP